MLNNHKTHAHIFNTKATIFIYFLELETGNIQLNKI